MSVDQKQYYCDSVKFNITKIKWDYNESNELNFPYGDLPTELHDWTVQGYPHWLESEWYTACIEQIQDAYYGWRIRHAKIERCETE